jgi:hypothetical protein
VLREQPRAIGAEAEERRVAERNDPGVAEDQIEGKREEREDRDLGENQVLARKKEQARGRKQPEGRFRRLPARAPRKIRGDFGGERARRGAQRPAAREKRPCGRQTSTTIMIV